MSILDQKLSSLKEKLTQAKQEYYKFIQQCKVSETKYKFTPNSEISIFALCFALFGLSFLGRRNELVAKKEIFQSVLKKNLSLYQKQREQNGNLLRFDKPFMQLLAFTLSCFHLLELMDDDPLEEVVTPLISQDVEKDLHSICALEGKPQSGNQAMFLAIVLLHAKNYLNIETEDRLRHWVDLHKKSMNAFGFWGQSKSMTHLQFQNGYHQYEIFRYLNLDIPNVVTTSHCVATLADELGHFAPYPGGGGCYDYDAVFLLTYPKLSIEDVNQGLLERTLKTILNEQNQDGGFSENTLLNNLRFQFGFQAIKHIMKAKHSILRKERLRQTLSVLRLKNRRIQTRWSRYSRKWNESNLWDSWFRMLTLALIQEKIFPELEMKWGWLKYPGIGYHE